MKDANVSLWKKALVIFGIVYLVSPVDLIPAVIFPFSFIDDLVLWSWILFKLKDTLDLYWVGEKESDYSKKYHGKNVIENVDFSIEDDENKEEKKADNNFK